MGNVLQNQYLRKINCNYHPEEEEAIKKLLNTCLLFVWAKSPLKR